MWQGCLIGQFSSNTLIQPSNGMALLHRKSRRATENGVFWAARGSTGKALMLECARHSTRIATRMLQLMKPNTFCDLGMDEARLGQHLRKLICLFFDTAGRELGRGGFEAFRGSQRAPNDHERLSGAYLWGKWTISSFYDRRIVFESCQILR